MRKKLTIGLVLGVIAIFAIVGTGVSLAGTADVNALPGFKGTATLQRAAGSHGGNLGFGHVQVIPNLNPASEFEHSGAFCPTK